MFFARTSSCLLPGGAWNDQDSVRYFVLPGTWRIAAKRPKFLTLRLFVVPTSGYLEPQLQISWPPTDAMADAPADLTLKDGLPEATERAPKPPTTQNPNRFVPALREAKPSHPTSPILFRCWV